MSETPAPPPALAALRRAGAVVWDLMDQTGQLNLNLVAAGCAFYSLLALFPAIAAVVSIYGLFGDPSEVRGHLALLAEIVPPEAFAIIDGQVLAIVSGRNSTLALSALVSLTIALWSAHQGTKSFMLALNQIDGARETRNYFRLTAIALALTAGSILIAVVAIAGVLVVPGLFAAFGLDDEVRAFIDRLRWPILALGVIVFVIVLYRIGPARRIGSVARVLPGALTATAIWIALSFAFSTYVENFGAYNEIYGSLGAVVILLFWFYLTAFVFLSGAALNFSIERVRAAYSVRAAADAAKSGKASARSPAGSST